MTYNTGVVRDECFAHRHRYVVPLDWHHIYPLAEGGPDTAANMVRLCPNAHRRVHDYIRLLKKHHGQVPWLKRKFFGPRVRYVGQMGYDAILTGIREVQYRKNLAAAERREAGES